MASVVQSLLSLQSASVGQAPGIPRGTALSHVSPGASTAPLPQDAEQSRSVLWLQPMPPGQQPSEGPHVVIMLCAHAAVHADAEPSTVSAVQTSPSLQSASVGQWPMVPAGIAGSQTSLES